MSDFVTFLAERAKAVVAFLVPLLAFCAIVLITRLIGYTISDDDLKLLFSTCVMNAVASAFVVHSTPNKA